MVCTVLITGSSGTIGSALAERLGRQPDQFRTVCLSRSAPDEPYPEGVLSVLGEFTDRSDLARVTTMAGRIDVVVHMAGVLSGGNGEDYQLAVNVVGTHALLTHFRDHGTQKFILASSIAAVGCLSPDFRPHRLPMPDDHPCDDPLGYGGSKYLMEEMSRLVSRQNPSLDIINLRIAGIQPDDTPPIVPPQPDTPGTVVQFGRMCKCSGVSVGFPGAPPILK